MVVDRGDTKALRAEIGRVKTEQRNLANAVAMAQDIPELLTEMNRSGFLSPRS